MKQEKMSDVSNWRKIWAEKEADENQLNSTNMETVFMELKRLTGNDTTGKGVAYEAFWEQYQKLKKEISFSISDDFLIKTVFEVGCGSGPFLMLFEYDNIGVGGVDYSKSLIETAAKILKNPIELYCDEAVNLKTECKYDCVYSNSVFEYFEDEEYAYKVLKRMYEKSNYSIGILDIHDADCEEEFIAYRKSIIENYEERYKDLPKLFYNKHFFLSFAKEYNMDIKFTNSNLKGYWNNRFVYDVFMYKHA